MVITKPSDAASLEDLLVAAEEQHIAFEDGRTVVILGQASSSRAIQLEETAVLRHVLGAVLAGTEAKVKTGDSELQGIMNQLIAANVRDPEQGAPEQNTPEGAAPDDIPDVPF
jgi:hypothetical protein